ncbi:MAG: SHOCT domain-containing protein [Eubacterium sp.]|nr:SHOCT domain-containing protein [Eubacterium sp.]
MIIIASISISMVVPLISDIIDDNNKIEEIEKEIIEIIADQKDVEKYKETMPNLYGYLGIDSLYNERIELRQDRIYGLNQRMLIKEIWTGVSIILGIVFFITIVLKVKKGKKLGIYCLNKSIQKKSICVIILLCFSDFFLALTLLYEIFDALFGNLADYDVDFSGVSPVGIIFFVITIIISILLISLLLKNYEIIPELADIEHSQIIEAKTNSNLSNLDSIAKLKELLDNNAITQEEFDIMKKEIINL